ncbi:hypothetical protein, partial [Caldisericum sp.]|uniref:hypothetical protein n=1 Tax=Caldisericum sp. TaxID=2499687 RepID=UPI003D13D8D0
MPLDEKIYQQVPFFNVWDIVLKESQKEEEEIKDKKKNKSKEKPKINPNPPANQISNDINVLEFKPRNPLSLHEINQMSLSKLFNKDTSYPQPPEETQSNIGFATPAYGQTTRGYYSLFHRDKTSVKRQQPIDEENRLLEILKGRLDPIFSKEEYQKPFQLEQELKSLQENPTNEPTGVNWIQQEQVPLEKIKKGISAGELFVKTAEYAPVKYYEQDPNTYAVTKKTVDIPIAFEVYGLVPREIEGKKYRVPTAKPLYYIDRYGNVKPYREGFLTTGIRAVGETLAGGPEKWDKFLKTILAVGRMPLLPLKGVPTITPPNAPYLPAELSEAVLGIPQNLPWSKQTLFEPGGKPVEPGNYPLYTKTVPTQKEVLENPFTGLELGIGTAFQPLTQIPNIIAGGVPQKPVTGVELGIQPTKEEIEKLKDKIQHDQNVSAVFNVISYLPMGLSKTLMGLLGAAFVTQPLTTEPSRPLLHKAAEGALNAALFWGVGRFNTVGKYIRKGEKIPGRVIARDIAVRTGLLASGEVFRNTFFYPSIQEEDTWRLLAPYVYSIGANLVFEAYGLGSYVKYNRRIKKMLPYEINKNLEEIEQRIAENPEEVFKNINEEEVKIETDPNLTESEKKALTLTAEALKIGKEAVEKTIPEINKKDIKQENAEQIALKNIEESISNKLLEQLEVKKPYEQIPKEEKGPATQEPIKTESVVPSETQQQTIAGELPKEESIVKEPELIKKPEEEIPTTQEITKALEGQQEPTQEEVAPGPYPEVEAKNVKGLKVNFMQKVKDLGYTTNLFLDTENQKIYAKTIDRNKVKMYDLSDKLFNPENWQAPEVRLILDRIENYMNNYPTTRKKIKEAFPSVDAYVTFKGMEKKGLLQQIQEETPAEKVTPPEKENVVEEVSPIEKVPPKEMENIAEEVPPVKEAKPKEKKKIVEEPPEEPLDILNQLDSYTKIDKDIATGIMGKETKKLVPKYVGKDKEGKVVVIYQDKKGNYITKPYDQLSLLDKLNIKKVTPREYKKQI